MTDLSDFGAGAPPEKKDDTIAHDSRTERAKHRRRTYRLGRCRAISTSKGCRCGGGIIDDSDGPLCYYHGMEKDGPATGPVMIDDAPDVLARWCGTRPTEWDDIPAPCRTAIESVMGDTDD